MQPILILKLFRIVSRGFIRKGGARLPGQCANHAFLPAATSKISFYFLYLNRMSDHGLLSRMLLMMCFMYGCLIASPQPPEWPQYYSMNWTIYSAPTPSVLLLPTPIVF